MKFIRLILCLSLSAMAGCGGGGGSAASPVQANKAVTFGLNDIFGNMTTQIKAVQVTATLPAGVSPNTDPDNRTLTTGDNGLKTSGNAFGRYSATTRQVLFTVIANPTIPLGEFARLTYNAAQGVTPSVSEFQVTDYKVSGPNSVDISARVSPTLVLVTY